MVFQNFALLPHLSVLRNVAFPLEVQGVGAGGARGAGARDDRARRAQGARGQPAARALGRAAAAGGDRPVAGGRARGLVPRRAVLGARPADPPRDAERVPAAAGRPAQDHRLHHPRLRRGDPARRPDRDHAGRADRAGGHGGGADPRAGGPLRRRLHPRRAAGADPVGAGGHAPARRGAGGGGGRGAGEGRRLRRRGRGGGAALCRRRGRAGDRHGRAGRGHGGAARAGRGSRSAGHERDGDPGAAARRAPAGAAGRSASVSSPSRSASPGCRGARSTGSGRRCRAACSCRSPTGSRRRWTGW